MRVEGYTTKQWTAPASLNDPGVLSRHSIIAFFSFFLGVGFDEVAPPSSSFPKGRLFHEPTKRNTKKKKKKSPAKSNLAPLPPTNLLRNREVLQYILEGGSLGSNIYKITRGRRKVRV